ncbi:MAG: metal-dependent hydrolase [Methanoregula sp.]|nr:metal-dependent hydrolase [Methanoregula sp.]
MLILGHLVIGLIIGFLLYELFHARTMIVFCALGSILPDLVDKVLGRVVFSSSLDNGRIFFHSLVIVLLFLITGLIIWNYYRSFSFLVVGFGVLLHQLVDIMWKSPVSWYYPILGPFPADITPDYFQQAFLAELTSVTEWIYFAAIVVVTVVLYHNLTLRNTLVDPDPLMQQKTRKFYFGLIGVALFVLALSVIIIALWDPLFNF